MVRGLDAQPICFLLEDFGAFLDAIRCRRQGNKGVFTKYLDSEVNAVAEFFDYVINNPTTDLGDMLLAWVTVQKDPLTDPLREWEMTGVKRVAGLWPRSCRAILLADRGFAAIERFHVLDRLGSDWIIRGRYHPGRGPTRGVDPAGHPGETPPGVAGFVVRPVWPIVWRPGLSMPDRHLGGRGVSGSWVLGRVRRVTRRHLAGLPHHAGDWGPRHSARCYDNG